MCSHTLSLACVWLVWLGKSVFTHTLPLCVSQDGVQLQKDTSLDDLWYSAMDAYRESNWQTVVDQIEEAIQVFDAYQNATLPCLQNCSENGENNSRRFEFSMYIVRPYLAVYIMGHS